MITPFTFGAAGDGVVDDTLAVQTALNAALGGRLHIPAGLFRITSPITTTCGKSISITGDGAGVAALLFDQTSGLTLNFTQSLLCQQPNGLTFRDVALQAIGDCGNALVVTYGAPTVTNDHYRPSVTLRDLRVESSSTGRWANGIDIADAWNVTLDNVFVSGDSAFGVWNNMDGVGINLRRMCVNAHFTNVRCNFWAVGFKAHAETLNTEGIFCSNCSMVAVKRGVWIKGNPALPAPRISTFTWVGGMIEARVGGVIGGSAAFHLQHLWSGLITGCQMLAETITDNVEFTYGVVPQDCAGIVVTNCDINALTHGVLTTGDCKSINVAHNTFTNVAAQVTFNPGTKNSRSAGNTCFNNTRAEVDHDGSNLITT